MSVATLIYFSGPQRGKIVRLTDDVYVIARDDSHIVDASQASGTRAASLHRHGKSFELVSRDESPLFVNGAAVNNAVLSSEDLIETADGTVFRYRLYLHDTHPSKSLREIFTDCADLARGDQRPIWQAAPTVALEGMRELLTQTSRWFRVGVVTAFALVGLALLATAWQSWNLTENLAQDQARLDKLESASQMAGNMIAHATPSVIFLQGTFGYRDPETGRQLRYLPDATGEPLRLPNGLPALTLNERGTVLSIDFSGTAFVVGPNGLLITNRHVVAPWENQTDTLSTLVGLNKLKGHLISLRGYVPGAGEAADVALLQASDNADLALLRGSGSMTTQRALPMASQVPQPGETVILLGYPAGVRALVARAPSELRDRLRRDKTKPSDIAIALAQSGLIQPLASRGIIGQTSETTIAYDAETTSGGSGGPLLNNRGQVVAINMAILPEFGGSNLGVPAMHAKRLINTFDNPPGNFGD